MISPDAVTRSIRLRPWQKAALDKLVASEQADFLAVATPGAGKTTFALTAARHLLAERPRRLVVVAPTAHLKVQWAQAAARFALHLDPAWSATDGRLPADMHGIVTTYQQVASSAATLAPLAQGAVVIFDEIHHAADDQAWGTSVREAFDGVAHRLSLSGTPFRSDTQAIPFVRYQLDEAVADFEYGYGDALRDRRVVRPVYFPRTGGHMEWTAPDGTLNEASFDDALDATRSSQRLRTALSLEGEWLPAVLRQAIDQLAAIRTVQPDAGGLVIATDQDHARGISALLRERFGARSTVVTSDDPDASDRIAGFARSLDPWLIAVRMVSEGVDIPRLRVGVYATTTTTELFFRQAVGRFVRWTAGVRDQKAFLFIPDDARLRARAFQIADLRRHSLTKRASEWAERDPAEFDTGQEEQLSLFAALSAVATGHELDEGPPGDAWDDDDVDGDLGFEDDPSLLVALAPPPSLGGGGPDADAFSAGTSDAGSGLTRREEKQRLRERNADLVASLVRRTGRTHPQVIAELNRMAGIGRVTEATIEQLPQAPRRRRTLAPQDLTCSPSRDAGRRAWAHFGPRKGRLGSGVDGLGRSRLGGAVRLDRRPGRRSPAPGLLRAVGRHQATDHLVHGPEHDQRDDGQAPVGRFTTKADQSAGAFSSAPRWAGPRVVALPQARSAPAPTSRSARPRDQLALVKRSACRGSSTVAAAAEQLRPRCRGPPRTAGRGGGGSPNRRPLAAASPTSHGFIGLPWRRACTRPTTSTGSMVPRISTAPAAVSAATHHFSFFHAQVHTAIRGAAHSSTSIQPSRPPWMPPGVRPA